MTDELIRKSDALALPYRLSPSLDAADGYYVSVDAIRALPDVTVGVRKLVWEAGERDQRRADSIVGEFCVTFFGGCWFYQGEPRKGMLDAQAAAQADYEARILAALTPTAVDASQVANPVVNAHTPAAIREAALREALKAFESAVDAHCERCGHPRSNHPYRHPFISSENTDPKAAILALIAKGAADDRA